MSKVSVPPGVAFSPLPAVMVSTGDRREHYNIATASWSGVVCSSPPMAYVSFRPATETEGIITRTREFVINLVPRGLVREMDYCGCVSMREGDKWEKLGLTPLPGTKVRAPIIAESPISLECAVRRRMHLGSHFMFLAEIVAVQADGQYVKDGVLSLEGIDFMHNIRGHYRAMGESLGRQGFSVGRG